MNLLDDLESSLRLVPEPGVSAAAAPASADRARGRREVWHWFVLAAAVLLAVEWLVSAVFLRT